jgi:actin-related protein
MTEEQRMEEGRRMFQIFAARMFEQRVLQAYREKVAAERQQRLLEELAEEDDKKEQKEAKKAKEAQKRKEKKDKLKQAKAEEKARKDAEIAAKEAEIKAAEEKRLEELRKKKEEQRKKKEAERKAQDEEKQRKESERLKRQQEERERQQEAERKAREHKAQEKKAREDAKRKEREEREAKEKEVREKKSQEEKDRREREAKAKAEKDRIRKEEQSVAQNATSTTRKVSQPLAPALPPGLLKQNSSTGFPSPHVTPAIPKAPTPSRPRQTSHQGSHGSSPKTPQVALGASKSISPASQTNNPIMPKSILTKPQTSQQPTPVHQAQPTSAMPPMGPPPGMQGPPGMGIGNLPPGLNGLNGLNGMNGFHGNASMLPGMMGGPRGHNIPMFPPPGSQNFRFPPPGMHTPNAMPMGRGFPMDGPPGFGAMPFGGPSQIPGFGLGMPPHSRQTSGSFEKPNADSPIAAPLAQPIQRPAPIQRPSSVKPHEMKGRRGSEVDELADHLGSKALLDDADDLPEYQEGTRRTSLQTHGSMRGMPMGFGFPDGPGQPRTDTYAPFGGSSNTPSVWGTPPMPFSMSGGGGWGNSPTSGMFNNPFSSMIGGPRPGEQRIVWIRRQVSSACKTLNRLPTQDGYVDASDVQQNVDSTISLQEIKEACDIFGDPSNGGGSLEYKEVAPGRLSHIKFVETGVPPPTLGEIGSPVPGHSIPVGGFGRPFPGLGPQGF